MESIKQAGKIKKSHIRPGRVFQFAPLSTKKFRKHLNVSQTEFAEMIGVSVDTLQNWEQGRREPEGPAKALLKIAAVNPEAVLVAPHA
jgi:putative transcriptional regulator